ncbi:hypothetical protein C1646_668421 [Rhizophagus diaphanus]|nr:hypothetical protein C1646_668421 [Rhizophagus diaphanus] [Rhizophagus sp. MUCL 43196]
MALIYFICPPCNATENMSDVKKTMQTDSRLTLYSLSMLSDGRFLVTELGTAVMPFSFNGRSQYKAIIRMMSTFHVNSIIKRVCHEPLSEREKQFIIQWISISRMKQKNNRISWVCLRHDLETKFIKLERKMYLRIIGTIDKDVFQAWIVPCAKLECLLAGLPR